MSRDFEETYSKTAQMTDEAAKILHNWGKETSMSKTQLIDRIFGWLNAQPDYKRRAVFKTLSKDFGVYAVRIRLDKVQDGAIPLPDESDATVLSTTQAEASNPAEIYSAAVQALDKTAAENTRHKQEPARRQRRA